MIFSQRYIVKPPTGTQINRGHPLSAGLAQFYDFSENGGGVVIDKAVGSQSSIQGTPLWDSGGSIFGKGITTGSSQGITPAQIPVTSKVTVAVAASFNSTPGNQHLYSRHPGWFISGNGTSVRFSTVVAGEVSVDFDTFSNLITNKINLYVGVYDGVNVTTYIDGIRKNQSAQSGNLDLSGTTKLGTYAGDPASASSIWPGDIYYAAFWTRAMSGAEVSWLSIEPYSLLLLPRKVSYFFAPASVATLGLRFNSSLSGLGASGPFFHDRLA